MKILLATPPEEEVGGVPHVVRTVSANLSSRGHEIFLFRTGRETRLSRESSPTGFPRFEIGLQMPFGGRNPLTSLAIFSARFPLAFVQLARLIKTLGIQIVNVHYPGQSHCYFALLRRILPIRLVTSVHGTDIFPNGRRRARYPTGLRLLLDWSDLVVTPSKAYRKDLLGIFPQLAMKTVAVWNGIDANELRALAQAGYEERVLPDSYLLCIAAQNEKKAIDVLLPAFRLVRQCYPGLQLVLVGDGPLREENQRLAASLGLDSAVLFLRKVDRSMVAQALSGCEAFVLPSRSEPFGIVLIEAFALGKPVVATQVGGIPEIVRDGVNGLLVPPDSPEALSAAILRVLGDKLLRDTLVQNARVAVEGFSAEKQAESYESHFRRLLTV